jgi:hypothetical protein
MRYKLDNKSFHNIHYILSIFNLCTILFDMHSDIDTRVNSEWLSYAPYVNVPLYTFLLYTLLKSKVYISYLYRQTLALYVSL